ncbi:MAG: ATP-dependent helicase, partial [Bacteroidota bacterium]
MNWLDDLNPAQRAAVECSEGPVMIVAGAGSGKTRVLTYRIAHLIEQGEDPFQILALTFTNKAAGEMRERIEALIGPRAKSLWMGTFHSVFARILRRHAELLGYPTNFTIYDADDSKSLIKNIVRELDLDDAHYKASNLYARISSAKNSMILVEEYAGDASLIAGDKAAGRPRFVEVYRAYVDRCHRSGAMDFDDLLLNIFKLLEQYPEVLNYYQVQFKHVLVDEFQDTNRVQYRIVRLLSAMHRNICLVGDDAQSIYAFRGAVIDNILNVHRDYPELQTFRLEQNYRSTGNIVGASGSVIAQNNKQIPKELWTQNTAGDKIRLLRCVSDNEEGRLIAAELHAAKHQFRLSNKDFAILYRTNAQSRAFEEALRRQNIPYKVIGGLSFYQRREIKDFLAYLRLVVNHADEEALRRVINYPARGIGRTSMDKWILEADREGLTLWQMLVAMEQGHPLGKALGAAGRKMSDFARAVQVWAVAAQRDNAIALARQVWKQSGLHAELQSDTTIEGVNRLQNVEELLNAIEEFCESDEAVPDEVTGEDDRSIGAFLQHIALLTSADDSTEDADRDYVSMMTVHQAKGLEFDHVFVVGMEEDLFPSAMARDNRLDLEEERRLFYVAITRARQRLCLSFALTRFRFGTLCYGEPSRFLFEMDPK